MTNIISRRFLRGLAFSAIALGLSWQLAGQEPARRPRNTIIEEEEEPTPRKPKAPAPAIGKLARLTEEAKKAEQPPVKKLFNELAQPHDIVALQNGLELKVQPLTHRYEEKGERGISYRPLGGEEEEAVRYVTRGAIRGVSHYELRAVSETRRLLEGGFDQPDLAGKVAVPRQTLLKATETALAEVLRFHLSLRDRKLRQGDEWGAVERELRQELLNVRIGQLKGLAERKEWGAAEALAAQLYRDHYTSRPLQDVIEAIFVAQARAALAAKDYVKARGFVETFERDYPGEQTAAVQAVKKELQDRAGSLVKESQELAAKAQTSQALQLLDEAERSWPRLAGIRDQRLQLQKLYPVLRVGVRSLPERFSPTGFQTDADRMASRLMFEPLLTAKAGPSALQGYESKFGTEPLRSLSDGWEFTLGRDILWSDGRAVTGADVRRSVEIAADSRSRTYDPAIAEILKVRIESPYRFSLLFSRAHLDPFALLGFDILPAYYSPQERSPQSPTWGNTPVGSGPYVLQRAGAAAGEVVFIANPFYRRPHAPEGPAIRELRFVSYSDVAQARQELTAGRLQMLLDLTTREAEELEGQATYQVMTPTAAGNVRPPHLQNSRVYFLAPNYRKPALQSEELRRAISLAIDREKVLAELFRGKSANYHRPLNGPFPVDSWAYNPDVPAVHCQPIAARAQLDRAKKELGMLPTLSLKHASEDSNAGRACTSIQAMLEAVGLKVGVQAVPELALAQELAKEQPDFDLVYWRHDFENETLSLWPLFDPAGVGARGRNFSGYRGDVEFEGLLRDVHLRLEFPYVQQQMRRLHKHFADRVIFIPLWQIDRHLAVHKSLKLTRIHPLWVFQDVDRWRLERME